MSPFRLSLLDFGDGDILTTAPVADELGFSRIWLAEHQAPAAAYADSLVMSMAVAAVTRRTRVGSGGVLLRFRSPLATANAARLLDAVFPGRIDLGLARGTVEGPELSAFLDGRPDVQSREEHLHRVHRTIAHLRNKSVERAIPRADSAPITWILDSSGSSAEAAAKMGAGYALSLMHSEVPPRTDAIATYRQAFVPSAELPQPAALVAVAMHCLLGAESSSRSTPSVHHEIAGSLEHCHSELERNVRDYDVDEIMVLELSADLKQREQVLMRLAKVCSLEQPEAVTVGPEDEFVPTIGDPVWRTRADALRYLDSSATPHKAARFRVYALTLPNGWRADVSSIPDATGLHRLVATARVSLK